MLKWVNLASTSNFLQITFSLTNPLQVPWNTLLKLLQLNLCWEGSVTQVHSNTCTPLLVSSKSFIWVGLLFINYLILLKVLPPWTTSLEESSVKIRLRNSFPHNTPKLCAWMSLERAFVERENSQPIISWHIILPSPQSIANYKVQRTTTSFYHHHSETSKILPGVIEIKT